MSEEDFEQRIIASEQRRSDLAHEFVIYEFEEEARRQLDQRRKVIEKSLASSSTRIIEVEEADGIFLEDMNVSVGTLIKNKALHLHTFYNVLTVTEQTVVSLGLNSIIDLSFAHTEAQGIIFKKSQWKHLRCTFPKPNYQPLEYSSIKDIIDPVFQKYNPKKSDKQNWIEIYVEVKKLQSTYEAEINRHHTDLDFCLFVLYQILLCIKHQASLFKEETEASEWDYLLKLWGPIMERLFYRKSLRLKWGDTHLTMKDTINGSLKVDLRVINDKLVQKTNQETEVCITEASKEHPSELKFHADQCKIQVENKVVIDNYIQSGCNIDSVDSIQICGLELFIVNLTLKAPSLYVGNEIYHVTINKSLSNISKYLDLALQLLCFRDMAVEIQNKYDDTCSDQRSNRKAAKRKSVELDDDESPQGKGKGEEKEKVSGNPNKLKWTRGTWIGWRDKAKIPDVPKNLTH